MRITERLVVKLLVGKINFSGMVIEESSGGFCISYGGFFNGAHCPIPTQSDPILTQSDPIPTHSKMIFHLGDYYITWGILHTWGILYITWGILHTWGIFT